MKKQILVSLGLWLPLTSPLIAAETNNVTFATPPSGDNVPPPEFTVTTMLQFTPAAEGEFAGLTVFGFDYALLGLRRSADGLRLVYVVNRGANRGAEEREVASVDAKNSTVYLRVLPLFRGFRTAPDRHLRAGRIASGSRGRPVAPPAQHPCRIDRAARAVSGNHQDQGGLKIPPQEADRRFRTICRGLDAHRTEAARHGPGIHQLAGRPERGPRVRAVRREGREPGLHRGHPRRLPRGGRED